MRIRFINFTSVIALLMSIMVTPAWSLTCEDIQNRYEMEISKNEKMIKKLTNDKQNQNKNIADLKNEIKGLKSNIDANDRKIAQYEKAINEIERVIRHKIDSEYRKKIRRINSLL